MQTTIDLPQEQMVQLNKLSEQTDVSPDAIVSAALAEYLAARECGLRDPVERMAALEQAFGLWADRGEDGLAYQERMRSEWEGRDWEIR